MKATELIGRNAIRTAPVKFNGDRSYTRDPIFIVNATENHVVIKRVTDTDKKIFGDALHVLNCDFADDNWTSYDGLIIDTNVAKEVKRPAKVGEWIKVVNADGTEGCYSNGDILQVVVVDDEWNVYVRTKKTHSTNRGACTSAVYIDEYVVLENYTPDKPICKPLSEYTSTELIAELSKRLEDK